MMRILKTGFDAAKTMMASFGLVLFLEMMIFGIDQSYRVVLDRALWPTLILFGIANDLIPSLVRRRAKVSGTP